MENNQSLNISSKPKNNILVIGIIGVAVVMIALAAIFLIPKIFNKNTGGSGKDNAKRPSLSEDIRYMIPDENFNFAIFDSKGKRKTEFVFGFPVNLMEDAPGRSFTFRGNSIAVLGEKNKVSIINTDGEVLLDKETCTVELAFENGTYYCTKRIDFVDTGYILDNKGDIAFELSEDDVKLNSSKKSALFSDNLLSSFYYENKIIVINRDAKEILRFESEKNYSIGVKGLNTENLYIFPYSLIRNGNQYYLYSYDKDKIVLEFESSEDYSFVLPAKHNYNFDEFILETATGKSKFIKDNKLVIDLAGEKINNLSFEGDVLKATDAFKTIIYDKEGKVLFELEGGSYIDYENYIKNNVADKSVEVYVDGKLFKTIPCHQVYWKNTLTYGGYAINDRACDSNAKLYDHQVIFIDANGEFINQEKYEYKPLYQTDGGFSSEGYAKVVIDKVYHLINTRGERITDYYSSLSIGLHGLITAGKAPKSYILNPDGSIFLESEGRSSTLNHARFFNNGKYYVYPLGEKNVALIDWEKREVLAKAEAVYMGNDYYVLQKDGKWNYHLLDGTLFNTTKPLY